MRRRLLVLDRYLTLVGALNRGDTDFHDRFILIGTNLVERLATRHALRHYFGIEQNLPNPISRSIECIASLNLQNESPSRLDLLRYLEPMPKQADCQQKP